jgi:glutaminase A-like protein
MTCYTSTTRTWPTPAVSLTTIPPSWPPMLMYESGAEGYVDIVALSARQVLEATTFSGTRDQPILFLKEISSNGNFQTIDVIFPSFPFFLYTSPRWLAYRLEPLIEHMISQQVRHARPGIAFPQRHRTP